MSTLLQSSLQPSSVPVYRRAWKLYTQFSDTIFRAAAVSLPISPPNVAFFISYLFQRNYASSTANSYVSALGYFHRIAGFPDPTKVHFIQEMLKGYGKLGHRLDARLPITLPILKRLLASTEAICSSHYRACLFKAMCGLAFFAFLRVGEITVTSDSADVLQLNQITKFVDAMGNTQALNVTFYKFKHHYNHRPISIRVARRDDLCPVALISAYLEIRGNSDGPLFRTLDGRPITRTVFTAFMRNVVTQCGLDPNQYKGHSFRIGAASHAAECGHTDAQIRLMGRWKSDAFKKYIRTTSI